MSLFSAAAGEWKWSAFEVDSVEEGVAATCPVDSMAHPSPRARFPTASQGYFGLGLADEDLLRLWATGL